MKLIGSLTEHRIREGLIKEKKDFEEKKGFYGSEKGTNIIVALEASLGNIRVVYMLRFLFDEGEEIYCFLVNGTTVVDLSITLEEDQKERIDIIECRNVKEYELDIKVKDDILTLMIVLELSKEALSQNK